MSDSQKRLLETLLWNVANTLRGNMNADEFRDYILGSIFYKYLAERMSFTPTASFSKKAAAIASLS